MEGNSPSFHATSVALSITEFRWIVFNYVKEMIASYSSSLQVKYDDFVKIEDSKLELAETLEEKKSQLLQDVENLLKTPIYQAERPKIEAFREKLGLRLSDILSKDMGQELVQIFHEISDLKNDLFGKKHPALSTESFDLVAKDNKIIMSSKAYQLSAVPFDVKLEISLRQSQDHQEFLARVMSRIERIREDQCVPTPSDLCAIQFAYQLLGQGVTLPRFQVSLGVPGYRPTQTYIAVTDAGPDNIKNTVQDISILTNGVTVHTEWIDRHESKDTLLVEAYRLPSHIWAARVRLHVGNLAPCSAYVGRGMFEGLGFDSMKTPRPFQDSATKYSEMNPDAPPFTEQNMFEAGLLKATRFIASACTSMFMNGIAECKISMENLSEKQAVKFMQAIKAQVMRDPGTQFLSAAFNVRKKLYSEELGMLTEPVDIAERSITVTKLGGFDKVTWDGSLPGVLPSIPIIKALPRNTLLGLVHKAHSVGLLSYISAGMTKEHMQDAVETGVDGIGIGNDLHYITEGLVGALNPKKMKEILAARDSAAEHVLGKGAKMLAKLDWLTYEAVFKDDHLIQLLFEALERRDEGTVNEILDKIPALPDVDVFDRHMAHARRLLQAKDPPLARYFPSQWQAKLSDLVDSKDTEGVVQFLAQPMKRYAQEENLPERADGMKLLSRSKKMPDLGNHKSLHAARPVSDALQKSQFSVVKNSEDLRQTIHARTKHGTTKLKKVVFDQADLREMLKEDILKCDLHDSYFVGECQLPEGLSEEELIRRGAVIIKPKKKLPFNPVRATMYSVKDLKESDKAIFDWVMKDDFTKYDKVMIALHDGMILDALNRFTKGKKIVGVMGGHAMLRGDPVYTKIAELCFSLAKQGFVIVSGGGPGAMEAANLGAYFADLTEAELKDAIAMLQNGNENFLGHEFDNVAAADAVLEKYNHENYGQLSLGIPTWLYGHEPFNRFARWQAKFVSNAIREDVLVNSCNCGIIFAPGAAGTRTEIFQFAVPNAYSKEDDKDFSKPMIFFTNFWIENTMYTTALNIAQREDMAKNKKTGYSTKIYCVTDSQEIIKIVSEFHREHYEAVPQPLAITSNIPSEQDISNAKRTAAYAAVDEWVTRDGMVVGIGSGTTIKYAAERLDQLIQKHNWTQIRVVPSSFQSRHVLAQYSRLKVVDMLSIQDPLEVDIDGTDEADIFLNLNKGGGGALLQEKVLAMSAKHFIVIADYRKKNALLLGETQPIPIEVLPLGHKRVMQLLESRFRAKCSLRQTGESKVTPFVTDNGNFILDVQFPPSLLRDPNALKEEISSIAGVLAVGLFCNMVTAAYFGYPDGTLEVKTRIPFSVASYPVPVVQQREILELIIQKVRESAAAKQNPVVELDLDLTSMIPNSRTVKGLLKVGEDYNIPEFREDPEKYIPLLPGYTAEAWNSFIEKISDITSKYPGLPWKAGKNAFAPLGTPDATVHSSFHIRFWQYPRELEEDIATPGLREFEERVISAGGKLVFLSGRWLPEQVEPTRRALRAAKLQQPENLIIGNPDHDKIPDSVVKQMHQETVKKLYGTPVAFFDDREANLKAVNEINCNTLICVIVGIPGFTNAFGTTTYPRASTFESAPAETRTNGAFAAPPTEPLNAVAEPAPTSAAPSETRSTLDEHRRALLRNAIARIPFASAPAAPNSVRVATFNVENLFFRYKFNSRNLDNPRTPEELTINQFDLSVYDSRSKELTAMAIRDANADILAMQEVESLGLLDYFVSQYLPDMNYRFRILIEGNDKRHINVGVLSRYPIMHIRSYRSEQRANSKQTLFSRDCLEVKVQVNDKELKLFVNHFKSMMGSREETHPLREEQANRVVDIIESQQVWNDNMIVLGDFNDYIDSQSALLRLVNHPNLENVLERLDEQDRWTHYYSKAREYKQLDFLLPCKALAQSEQNKTTKPGVIRKGQPRRATRVAEHYDGIGLDRPKASDHCPLFMDFILN